MELLSEKVVINSILQGLLSLKEFWIPFGGLLLGLLLMKIVADLIKRESKIRWFLNKNKLDDILKLTPTEFEEYVAELYKSMGYKARTVGRAGDHGIDVEIEKDGVREYVQCKLYNNRTKVGEGEIRDFYGSITDKLKEGNGYFVTTSTFTYPAIKFAKGKPIKLIDQYELVRRMKKAKEMKMISEH